MAYIFLCVQMVTLSLSQIGYSAETQNLQLNSVESQFTFDAGELNQLREKATLEVDEFFSNTSQKVLSELAVSYFHQNEYKYGSPADLLSAYRAETIIYRLHELLKVRYPGEILDELVWVWNNVGGIYARLAVVSCSMSEYIAFFGTPLEQTGYSGEYPYMDVYDIMISGEMYSHGPSSGEGFPQTYLEGDVSLLKRNESRVYKMGKFSYMLDYGRGFVPAALWQGIIAPYLFVNHDSQSAKEQLKACATAILKRTKNTLLGS
jgi:hypothetical protein